MDFDAFRKYWNDKYCEVAGSSNAINQCVDLANAYIRDVLRQPIIEWTNAVDFPLRAGDKYEFIKNTPTNVPQKGDIIVWRPSPGHIAIFIEGDVKRFTSFDQNFPVGSKCHVQEHNYTNVDGWLRCKVVPDYSTITIKTSERDWLVGRATTAKEVGEYLALNQPDHALTADYTKAIAGIKSATTACQTNLSEKGIELAKALQEVDNRIEQVKRIKQTAEESAKLYEAQIEALKKSGVGVEELERQYKGRIEALEKQVDELSKLKGTLQNELAVCKAGQPKDSPLIALLKKLGL